MKKEDKKYIKLYAEDFDADVWEEYCNAAEAPLSATSLTIFFDPDEAEYSEDEEDNTEYSEDGDYLIVEEDGTKHYYDDEPDVEVIHGFVCGLCTDITVYKKTEDGEWEEIETYHA